MAAQGKEKSVEELCREVGVSPATFYQWKSKYGSMSSEELKRMRELEAKNARLKKLLADKSLDYVPKPLSSPIGVLGSCFTTGVAKARLGITNECTGSIKPKN